MKVSRRKFLAGTAVAGLSVQPWLHGESTKRARDGALSANKVPVIDVTDLYQPFEDVGDNFDLVQAHALPEVDLRAVVLDVSDAFRLPVANDPAMWRDPNGPREPGIVPVTQLNALFDRDVAYAYGPFAAMKTLTDTMTDAPKLQQAGIELILRTLQESERPVEIVSFGSARTIAVAFNREPELMRRKLGRIHVSAGTASKHFELGASQSHNALPGGEWNVALDSLAFIRLMRSDLPIALYPCATIDGAFAYGAHNTYWNLPNLHFLREIDPRLRNYMIFALGRMVRADFLRCLDGRLEEGDTHDLINRVHHVWETAVWLNVADRKVVQRGGAWRIVPAAEVQTNERVLKNDLRPCSLQVRDDGRIAFELNDSGSNISIFERGDPQEYEQALREALPAWWKTFQSVANA